MCASSLTHRTDFAIRPAFLLATGVVLDVKGEASKTLSHFDSSSSDSGLNFGWGPFQVDGKSSHKADHKAATCEKTDVGCK